MLYRRPKPNGVVRSRHHVVRKPADSQANVDSQKHSISYTLSRNQAVVVEYTHDESSDLFQIGRSSESPIDFVVMDTVPGNKAPGRIPVNSQSTISRFACRIIANRDEKELQCSIFAAGFDSARNISLGEKATKWESNEHEVDGLTTNGVLIMHPQGVFCPPPAQSTKGGGGDENEEPVKPAVASIWREVSVGGKIFGLRESRSAAEQGVPVPQESNKMVDGTMIDLCGATLLWRSAEGLKNSPTPRQLERCLDDLNAGRPQCPVGLHTLVVPTRRSSSQVAPEAQPVVYLNCGHVQVCQLIFNRVNRANEGHFRASMNGA